MDCRIQVGELAAFLVPDDFAAAVNVQMVSRHITNRNVAGKAIALSAAPDLMAAVHLRSHQLFVGGAVPLLLYASVQNIAHTCPSSVKGASLADF